MARKSRIPYPPSPHYPGADVSDDVYAAYKRAYRAWDDMVRAVRWVSDDTPSDPVYTLRCKDESFRSRCDAAVTSGDIEEARKLQREAVARW